MLKRCLIANRGEVAVRIIQACRELGIESVAIYSTADKDALYVKQADFAFLIGEAPPSESYLQAERIIQTAQAAACDCVHPGFGFLAENAAFARSVLEAGLEWVGPGPQAIQAMGSKTEARALMLKAGVPVVPGFQEDVQQEDEWKAAAEAIGYPVMVKASGGGGGKGIRIVQQADDLLSAIEMAQNEAQRAFNDRRVFLEKYIEQGRHIEVQILADKKGHVIHLFERECSVQRRHQKIIEESPSISISEEIRSAMGKAAVDAAASVGYVNAGTVEFILSEDGSFYFLEMNTRLQVEHPVTEFVTGIDIVKMQFKIASGEPLQLNQADIKQQGHAIECRVYAEDPNNQFLPSIGEVLFFKPPQGAGIRVDSGIQSRDQITLHYDPMIAKVITYGQTRSEAIERMRYALAQSVILGTKTNIGFLQNLLNHPDFIDGKMDTRYIDRNLEHLLPEESALDEDTLIGLALFEWQLAAQHQPVSGEQRGDRFSPWLSYPNLRLGVKNAD
ncbi:acetyl-CoA carboxylase biotin carboxylase subunit [Anaerolineales bacterium]